MGIELDLGGFAPQASRTIKYEGVVGYGIVVCISVEIIDVEVVVSNFVEVVS
jgi:hypothetical protein